MRQAAHWVVRLLLAWSLTVTTWAEPAQPPPEPLLELRVGETRTLPFTQLIRFTIKDTKRLAVKRIEGDQVTVVGVSPGETWLEVVHGERHLAGIRVRILPGEPSSPSTAVVAANPETKPPPAPPNQLRQPTFSVSLDPTAGFDSQRVSLVGLDPAGDVIATRDETFRGSFQTLPLTVTWSPDTEDRLFFQIPYVLRTQETLSRAGAKTTVSDQGIGDIRLGYEHTFRRSLFEWDTALGVTASLPTGKAPYDLGPGELPLGIGHTELGANVSATRVFDPVALRVSAGLDYTLPRTVLDRRIVPGLGYSFETTFTYALTDQWTMSEQLLFNRRPNVFLLNPVDPQVQVIDQAYVTHSLSYSPDRDVLVRFLLSVGLNEASTDYILGLSAQWRR